MTMVVLNLLILRMCRNGGAYAMSVSQPMTVRIVVSLLLVRADWRAPESPRPPARTDGAFALSPAGSLLRRVARPLTVLRAIVFDVLLAPWGRRGAWAMSPRRLR